MNKTTNRATKGQWIFAIAVVSMLATIYAAQAGLTALLFACVIISIILSLALLILLLQSGKAVGEAEQEVRYLKQRENDRLQKEKQTAEQQTEQVEEFKIDDILARIIPAKEVIFDNAGKYSEKILQNLGKELDIVQGLVFVLNDTDQQFHVSGEFAYFSEEQPRSFPLGETLSGQVAKNQQLLNVKELPEGYITVLSGLGKSDPHHLIIAPVVHKGNSIGVIELASFKPFGKNEEQLAGKVAESMANQLNELRKKI